MLSFTQLAALVHGQILQQVFDDEIHYLITDSRKILSSPKSLFFAIKGVRNDGHDHIQSAYDQGVRQFVVEREIDLKKIPLANIVKVQSCVLALQQIAIDHRSNFSYPVIGITGSNGKTIVKEWLYQMLTDEYQCVKNPGSYNSQVGVPLSVWQMGALHNLGIFEAGISVPGEMENLQKIIQPTIGLITNIGPAHDEGFRTRREKLNEKLKLFKDAETLIYCTDYDEISEALASLTTKPPNIIAWGQNPASNVLLKFINDEFVEISGQFGSLNISLPFEDSASKENVLHCVMVLLHLGVDRATIQKKVDMLRSIPMRLELKMGINQCQVVDDTYNNDLGGVQIGLDFLEGLNKKKKTLILSDVLQSGLTLEDLSKKIALLLKEKDIQKFIGIGFGFHSHQNPFDDLPIEKNFYLTTEDFIREARWDEFFNEAILVKGARVFHFEKIVQLLQKKIHGTVMEVDLGAMVHNLNFLRSLLKPNVKLMAMVKAFAYGSGSNEIASLLQYHHVDYLGVAYVDEGVELRANQVSVPIMVMNPSEESFSTMLEKNLEPEIYSMQLLKALVTFLEGRNCSIHLKIDTGMHRLGFEPNELDQVIAVLNDYPNVKVASVFSHLAGADEAKHDNFSTKQAQKFEAAAEIIKQKIGQRPLRHLLNSSGILRFPDYQYEMVRLGIGLYGIDPSDKHQDRLRPVTSLKTVISQVKRVQKGETIGYGRKGSAEHQKTTATLAIGYADGYSRGFGNGIGHVLIHGKKAPVLGNVCMDMTMVDITGIPEAKEGDEVVVFGPGLAITELAAMINTIPYEILTNTSERVKRIFYAESI